MKRVIEIIVLLHFAWLPCQAFAQADPAAIRTTDDPRRIRIPPPAEPERAPVVLRGGTIIDGTGAERIAEGVAVIRGDRIAAVGRADEVRIPAGDAQVVDTSDMYVLPGLIDLHIHLAQEWKEDDSLYRDSDAAAAIRGLESCRCCSTAVSRRSAMSVRAMTWP